MAASVYRSSEHRITYNGVSLVENALENTNLVQVSVMNGCTIMVAPNNYGISYLPNGEYKSWSLTGFNTRLNDVSAHYIYARLSRNGSDAMILFSLKKYLPDGSIDGDSSSEPSTEYFYIKIGDITETNSDGTLTRDITLDFGYLNTPQREDDNQGWKEMFELTGEKLINPLKEFAALIVNGTMQIVGKLILNKKVVTDVAKESDEEKKEPNDETIPTTAYLDGVFTEDLRSVFLNKDKPDTTNYLVSLLGGLLSDDIKSQSFAEGLLGSGFGAWMDNKGQSHIEVDNLLVRLKAEFESLGIREITHIGGELILSNASMTCSKVENMGASQLYYSDDTEVVFSDGTKAETPAVYRCYFTQDDKEKSITNDFALGDLVTCRTWNIKAGIYEDVTNRYYWRLVVGIGDDYIDLSSVDYDANEGSAGVPSAGDKIVQLGNKFDEDRQTAIVLSTYGDDAPSVKLYRGINSYSLADKEFFDVSRKQVSATVDKLRLKGKDSTYLNVGEELDSRPTAEDLLNVGINIGTRQVTVTADKFLVRTPKGAEVAVFTTKDGKPVLRAGLIDVDSLFAGTVNANDATITNFTFANAQSKDGSFSVDGNGVTKIGGFTITKNSIGSSVIGDKMTLKPDGILFESSTKKAGVGDVFPSSTASRSTACMAALFDVTMLHGNYHRPIPTSTSADYVGEGVVCINTTGGIYNSSYDSRQIGLSITTQDATKDTAIDLKGRIRTNGQFGVTTDDCQLGTGYTLIFNNGVLVGIKQS